MDKMVEIVIHAAIKLKPEFDTADEWLITSEIETDFENIEIDNAVYEIKILNTNVEWE